MTQKLYMDEDRIIRKIMEFLTDCDADDLARLAGDVFGGKCFFVSGGYEFSPDENYGGAFGNIPNSPDLSPEVSGEELKR